MNILGRMFRDAFEYKAGRIRISSGGWAFNPSPALVEKTKKRTPAFVSGLMKSEDATGKEMFLVAQRSVNCANPDVGKDHPQYKENKKWCVPARICRKCQFYRKADHQRRYRFPRCIWKSSANPGQDALKETFSIFDKAVAETKKIMGQ